MTQTQKGGIDLTRTDTKNALNRIRELISMCQSDALNVKKENFKAVLDLIDELERRLVNLDSNEKKANLIPVCLKLMTTNQKDKLIEEMI